MKAEKTAVTSGVVKHFLIIACAGKRSRVRKVLRTPRVWQADADYFAGNQILEDIQFPSVHPFKLIQIDKHCLRYFGQIILVARVDKTGRKIGAQFGRQQVVDKRSLSDVLYFAAKQQNSVVHHIVLCGGSAHSHQITFQTFYPKFLVTSMHAVGKDTDIIRSVPFRQRV